jgi:UrcA family protein
MQFPNAKEALVKTISARLISTLSIVALLGVSATAFAVGPIALAEKVVTQKVRVADLDLSTAAGADTLYSRIKGAARVVCRDERSYKLESACQARAIDNAVMAVGSPLLASVHGSATGRIVEVVAR